MLNAVPVGKSGRPCDRLDGGVLAGGSYAAERIA